MATVYVFLAPGFEEIEAITPVDILRRAGATVYTVGVAAKQVTGSHNITIEADIDGSSGFTLPPEADMVVLPGGGPGTEGLRASAMVRGAVTDANAAGKYVAAICAAPTVLHRLGLLSGRTVTAFPGVQKELTDAHVTGAPVEVDGNIVTARSAGVALQFSHTLIQLMLGKQKADEIIASVYPAL